MYALYILCVNM